MKNINKKTVKKLKRKIPATVRNTVWNTYAGIEKGVADCFCCKLEQISRANFDCGHIIAEKNGGLDTVQNLRPICGLCNSSMGTENMLEFMEKYGFNELELAKNINFKHDVAEIVRFREPFDVVDLMEGHLKHEELCILMIMDISDAINYICINRTACVAEINRPLLTVTNGEKDYRLLYVNKKWIIGSVDKVMMFYLLQLLERSLPTKTYTKTFNEITENKVCVNLNLDVNCFIEDLYNKFNSMINYKSENDKKPLDVLPK